MRRRLIACLIGMTPLCGSGCIITHQMADNLRWEYKLYKTQKRMEERMDKDADRVLREIGNRHPHRAFTKDFRDGFHVGFKDFLTYGGPALPPVAPPEQYRNAKYLTPEGHCMVRDWFLGFTYGVQCAEATGMRQFYTLPVLVSDMQPPPPLDIVVLPAPPNPDATQPAAPEVAPVPKPATDVPGIPQAMPAEPVKPEPAKPEPPPVLETPRVEPVKPDPVKPEPPPVQEAPKLETPKIEPPKLEVPPVTVPRVEPAPRPPVPATPTSSPPPIPLIPTRPTVSISIPPPSPTVVPVGGGQPGR